MVDLPAAFIPALTVILPLAAVLIASAGGVARGAL
jgi:hypothetical protein